jgi:hypothetical protein
MDTKNFLASVLAPDGIYCAFGSRLADDRKIQKFSTSLEELEADVLKMDRAGYEAYIALATFKTKESRSANNSDKLKSLFLDLDCGPGKDFATKQDALSALRKFCADSDLPRPMLIDSGRGIHVYWRFDTPVDSPVWLAIASRLKEQCANLGFPTDSAVTNDRARVLRVVGTLNRKGNPAEPPVVKLIGSVPDTTTIGHISAKLNADSDVAHANTDILRQASAAAAGLDPTMGAVMAKLVSNKAVYFKDILVMSLEGKGCTQLVNIATNQEDIAEPLWRAGLSIAAFCEDRDKAGHAISKKHPLYDFEDTQEKLERVKGPYLCERFEELNPRGCAGCAHKGKIKSPISLGARVQEAEAEDNVFTVEVAVDDEAGEVIQVQHTIPPYPKPYFRGKTGGVYVRRTSEDGEPEDKCVYHNDLYIVKRVRDIEVGEAVVVRLHLPVDGIREFLVPLASITSREELRKALAQQGVAVLNPQEIMQYLTTCVNELQGSSAALDARSQFGWTDNTFTRFVLGDREYTLGETMTNHESSHTGGLFAAFTPKGSLQGWCEAVHFYNRPGMEVHQLVLGSGFGSILMQLDAVHCAALHLKGGSGVGKTTAMAAAASIWGNPEDLIIHERDTYNSKMHRAEVYHNLPWLMDELTNTPPEELSNLLYQITGGKQRNRMGSKANAERSRGASWHLLLVTTGNRSIVEAISGIKAAPTAEAQRILECEVPKTLTAADKAASDAMSMALRKNYGHAGEVFVRYVMNNLPEVKDLVAAMRTRVDTAACLGPENRFWSAFATYSLVGLVIARKVGLVRYNVETVTDWTISLLRENRAGMSDFDVDPLAMINEYIAANWSSILWMRGDVKVSPALNKDEATRIFLPEKAAGNRLVGRYETDTKRVYLMLTPLKEWCIQRQLSYKALRDVLVARGIGAQVRYRIGKGTQMNLPATQCLSVDMFIDVETPPAGL